MPDIHTETLPIAAVIKDGKNVTYDLRKDRNEPSVGTSQVADAVIAQLKK